MPELNVKCHSRGTIGILEPYSTLTSWWGRGRFRLRAAEVERLEQPPQVCRLDSFHNAATAPLAVFRDVAANPYNTAALE